MSLKFLFKQGRHLVTRAEDGSIVRNVDGTQQRALAPTRTEELAAAPRERKQTWRRNLARLTNNGADAHETLVRLMRGEVHMPVGRDPHTGATLRGEPVTPSAEVMRAAAVNIHEMLHGKSVAETEVRAAEEEAEKRQQLEAMSEEELMRVVEGEVVEKKPLAPALPPTTP